MPKSVKHGVKSVVGALGLPSDASLQDITALFSLSAEQRQEELQGIVELLSKETYRENREEILQHLGEWFLVKQHTDVLTALLQEHLKEGLSYFLPAVTLVAEVRLISLLAELPGEMIARLNETESQLKDYVSALFDFRPPGRPLGSIANLESKNKANEERRKQAEERLLRAIRELGGDEKYEGAKLKAKLAECCRVTPRTVRDWIKASEKSLDELVELSQEQKRKKKTKFN